MGLLAGVVPATEEAGGTAAAGRMRASTGGMAAAERVIRFWRRLGLPLATCAEQAVITPACGLVGATPAEQAPRWRNARRRRTWCLS